MIFKDEKLREGLTEDQINLIDAMTEDQFSALSHVVSKKINAVNREIYGNVETVVKEITGIERQENQKATEYVKTSFSAAIADAHKDEIEGLKNDLKTARSKGNPSDVEKKYNALVEEKNEWSKKVIDIENEYKEKLTKTTNDLDSFKLNSALDKAVPKLKYEDADYSKFITDKKKAELLASHEVSINESGDLEIKKDLRTIDSKEIMTSLFKDHIEPVRAVGGNGGGKGDPKPREGVTYDVSTATTKEQAAGIISKSLLKSGMANGSAEYNKAMAEALASDDLKDLEELV